MYIPFVLYIPYVVYYMTYTTIPRYIVLLVLF